MGFSCIQSSVSFICRAQSVTLLLVFAVFSGQSYNQSDWWWLVGLFLADEALFFSLFVLIFPSCYFRHVRPFIKHFNLLAY